MNKACWIPLAALLLSGCATGGAKKAEESTFFPPLPMQPRLQYLTSITTEDDIGGGDSSAMKDWLVGRRPSRRQVARPQAFGSVDGKIYVLDRTFKKVLILDLDGRKFDALQDAREGALGDPMGLFVSPEEWKYVADLGRKQVLVYDRDNRFVRAYGEPGQFERPMDVAVRGDRVYVVDFSLAKVFVLDRDSGEQLLEFGSSGQQAGQFNRPTHLALDAAGNVYVNDSFNYRIQKFDPEGRYLKEFGYQGDTLGGFARPKGIGVDRAGYVYAVDAAFENAQIFDPESADLLLFFGGFGPHTGSMYLPSGLHIDYHNIERFRRYIDKDFAVEYLLYVGNMLGDRKINVYGFGKWVGAPLPESGRAPAPAPARTDHEH